MDDLHFVISQFLQGDSSQYEIIRRAISRYVNLRYTATAEEREELTADVLQALYANLSRGQFSGKNLKTLDAYIFGIARLKIMHALQRRANQSRTQPLVEDYNLLAESRRLDPHEETVVKDLARRIYAAIPQKCRDLLLLKFQEDWSDQEIATSRRMTKNAVSTAISRCIRRAQKLPFLREFLYEKRTGKHSRGKEEGDAM